MDFNSKLIFHIAFKCSIKRIFYMEKLATKRPYHENNDTLKITEMTFEEYKTSHRLMNTIWEI